MPDSYPVDTEWRITAKFEPYPEPRALPVPDVTSGMIEYQTPGELVFRANGREHRLIAVLQQLGFSELPVGSSKVRFSRRKAC